MKKQQPEEEAKIQQDQIVEARIVEQVLIEVD